MKRPGLSQLFLFLMLLTLTGCDVIVGIFEAGMWVGIIIVILLILLIIWIFRKLS